MQTLIRSLLVLLVPVIAFAGQTLFTSQNPNLLLYELGPVEIGQDQDTPSYVVDGQIYLPEFRVQSFGETKIQWTIRDNQKRPMGVWVEGPFADGDAADRVAPGEGPAYLNVRNEGDGELTFSMELKAVGIYRVFLGRPDWFSGNSTPTTDESFSFHTVCNANCFRSEITLPTLLKQFKRKGQLKILKAALNPYVRQLPYGWMMANRWLGTLDSIADDPSAEKNYARFPTLPQPYEMGQWLPQTEKFGKPRTQTESAIRGDLRALLADCTYSRFAEKPLLPELPDVSYGHFTSQTMSNCQLAQSDRLAQILTALAVAPGTEITLDWSGKHYAAHTTKELFQILLATGHTIEARNERTYANFLSFKVGNQETRIPVWIKTGFSLAESGEFAVPLGHSEQAWRIWGPLVHARVTTFLGLYGSGFFGITDTRPVWTGYYARNIFRSGPEGREDKILTSVDASAAYIRRNRLESKNVPNDGYGVQGVCNDSNALVEKLNLGTVTSYPLMRPLKLDTHSTVEDSFSPILAELPHDGDTQIARLRGQALATYRKDVLCRAMLMYSHWGTPGEVWDPLYKQQIHEIYVSHPCP